ncbi:MAG: hypothetical protein GQ565_01480 [Candidatus Aegiribacteria sp.]|nr:hypothetical protein [Candidatus Aegiribacteria sp.]
MKLKLLKYRTSIIVYLVMFALFGTPVTASIPSFLQNLGFQPMDDSGDETQQLISSIPALEELPGIRFSALVIDLPSGNPVVLSGEGVFTFDIPEVFILAHAIDMMLVDTIVGGSPQEIETVSSWIADAGMNDTHLVGTGSHDSPETISSSSTEDVARALRIIHSGMDMPSVREILDNPDMGEGQASGVGAGWDLYGWADSGENHKTFALIAISPEGRELGFILLSDDLCCNEKGDLAMMLLWEAAQQL